MKILIPIGSIYPSQQGGPSNFMYWVAHGLVNEGFDITIVSTDIMLNKSIKRNKWLQTTYGKVIFFDFYFNAFPIKAIWAVWKKTRNIDVMHLNSIFYPFSFICGIFALLHKKPIIWSVNGELNIEALKISRWKKKLYLLMFKKFFAKRATFHATVQQEAVFTKKSLGNNISVSVIPLYMILPQKVLYEKKKYISYIGRIHQIKAIENLIDAAVMSKVFIKSDFTLKVAGDTNNTYGISLKNKVKVAGLERKIEFVGHVEGLRKEQFLAGSFFNIMPSHSENFGLVVIESLAQGTPVIASHGTPWQILEERKCGFWVNNSSESLTSILDYIFLLDLALYEQYRKKALELSEEFDINLGVSSWINLYRSQT